MTIPHSNVNKWSLESRCLSRNIVYLTVVKAWGKPNMIYIVATEPPWKQ